MYDTTTWTEISSASIERSDWVYALSFSPNGKILVVGDFDSKAALLYDTTTWTEIASIERGVDVLALSFSPDGSNLVVGARDGKAIVYDVYAD